MYKDLLPNEIVKFEVFIQNQKQQLENYKKSENAKQNFIIQKETDLFNLQTFANVIKNSLSEFELEKQEYGNTRYMQGIKENDNEREKSLTKNLYHAGSFITEYLTALQSLHEKTNNKAN